jgi:PAS domain S-box-containing protein
MSKNTKILLQLAGGFLGVAILLYTMDQQMLALPAGSSPAPYMYFSIVALFVLFGVTTAIFRNQAEETNSQLDALSSQLQEMQQRLSITTTDLEQQVERRTFEFSVANASLNREIAERIQAEAETKRVQRRMELILESAGEGIFGLDTAGRVTFVNKAAGRMLAWDPDELVGLEHHALIHHTYADGRPYPVSACPIHQAYRDGKVHFGDDEVFWKSDGSSFPVQYVSTPIREYEKLTGAVVVFRNLSACANPVLGASHEQS